MDHLKLDMLHIIPANIKNNELGIKNIISLYSFNIGNKVLWEESPRRKRKHDFVYYSSFKMRHVPEKSRRGDHVLLPMIITHIRQKT